MARKNPRYLARNFAISTLFASLLIGFLTPTSANALVLVRPATHWGNVYAGPASSTNQTAKPKVAYLEKKSKIIVKYNNFPEWTKVQVQAAVDVWAANFESKVPIYIDATWGRSSSFSVLGRRARVVILLIFQALLIPVSGIHRR
jgi:hypothetical protein